jgi:hypothetical protein
MNRRINELKQAAGVDDNPDQAGLDLFAQLIIEACSQAIADSHSWRAPAVAEIQRHFGVE